MLVCCTGVHDPSPQRAPYTCLPRHTRFGLRNGVNCASRGHGKHVDFRAVSAGMPGSRPRVPAGCPVRRGTPLLERNWHGCAPTSGRLAASHAPSALVARARIGCVVLRSPVTWLGKDEALECKLYIECFFPHHGQWNRNCRAPVTQPSPTSARCSRSPLRNRRCCPAQSGPLSGLHMKTSMEVSLVRGAPVGFRR